MFWNKKHTAPGATYKEVWQKGDTANKLSFFIMGLTAIKHHQWVKGFSFLITEIVFIAWFIFGGISSLSMLSNLGAIKKTQVVYDKVKGVYVTRQPDNSIIILLFGLLALFLCIGFIWLYIINLKSNRKTYVLVRDNKHIPTNYEELNSLLNSRLHSTLMFIPVLGIILFTVLPTIFMTFLAFTNYDSHHAIAFSWWGLNAFKDVIAGNLASTFFPVLGWTIVWATAATFSCFFFGVLLAMLIESKGIVARPFWRTIFIIAYAVPHFVSLLMMAQFLDYQGAFNSILMNLHLIAAPIHFIDNQASPLVARITVIIVNMWTGIPVTMLISTAIIQNLPQDQIEAAKMDGANALQVFKKITFPQILFVMSPALIQQFIGNINNFNVIFLLTGGAPMNANYDGAGSTDLLVTWLYNLTFGTEQRYNASAVLGILIFILSATVSLIAYRHTNAYKEG